MPRVPGIRIGGQYFQNRAALRARVREILIQYGAPRITSRHVSQLCHRLLKNLNTSPEREPPDDHR